MGGDKGLDASQILFQTFTLFPRLPIELRRQIWSNALPDGTYIHYVRTHTYRHKDMRQQITRYSPNPFSVPALLHTNAESRSVALEHLCLLGVGPSRIYFNPAVDTLLLGLLFRTYCYDMIHQPEMVLGENVKKLRHLALYDMPNYCHWFQPPLLRNWESTLESFTVLDMRDWERATRYINTTQAQHNLRGTINYAAIKEALSPGVFKVDRLVRVEEEPLGFAGMYGMPFSRYQGLAGRVRSVWREVGDRPLDVKVMKLPHVGAEKGQQDETKEKVETVSVAVDSKQAESPGDGAKCKRRGRRKLMKWRPLERLLSKLSL